MGSGGRPPACAAPPACRRDPDLVALQPARVAQAQVLVRDALRARQQRVGELLGLQVGIALDILEPLGGIARRVLDLEHLDAAHIFVVLQALPRDRRSSSRQRASSMASSSASLVPEPMEKCAVCAASPISTTGTRRWPRGVASAFQRTQASQMTRGKRIQMAEPRRCAALLISLWPSSQGANSFSQIGDALFLAHPADAGGLPGLFRRLDDEGGKCRLQSGRHAPGTSRARSARRRR